MIEIQFFPDEVDVSYGNIRQFLQSVDEPLVTNNDKIEEHSCSKYSLSPSSRIKKIKLIPNQVR